MEAGLLGQAGDNARDPAERDYRRENGPVRTRLLDMEERNAWAHLNSKGIVSLVGAGVRKLTSNFYKNEYEIEMRKCKSISLDKSDHHQLFSYLFNFPFCIRWRLVCLVKLGTMYGILRDGTTDPKTVLYKPVSWIWRKEMYGLVPTA